MDGKLCYIATERVMDLKGCRTGIRLLICLGTYLESEYNLVMKDGNKVRVSDIANDFNITRQAISTSLKYLEDNNVIKYLKMNRRQYICINPCYLKKEKKVAKTIYKLFGEENGRNRSKKAKI